MTELVLPPPRPVSEQTPAARLWNATLGWLAHQPSEHTRIAYNRGLTGLGPSGEPAKMAMPGWLPWLHEHGIAPLAADLGTVDLYARAMAGTGMADRSQAQRLALISSWYSYLVDVKLIDYNPAARATRPNIDPDDSPGATLSEAEVWALIAQAAKDGPMAYALILLLYFGGYRIDSVLSPNVGHLGWDENQRTLRMRLKGGKMGTKILERPAAEALDAYLAGRGDLPADAPLFVGVRDGRRLNRRTMWQVIRRLAKQAGIKSWAELNLHGMRHAHIDAALNAGVPVHVLAASVNHRQVTTTMGYARQLEAKKSENRSGAKLADRWEAGIDNEDSDPPGGQEGSS